MTGDPWVEDDLSEEDEDHLTASMGVGAATFTKASRKTMHASEVQAVHAQNTALRTVLVGLDPVWRPAASAFAAFRDAFGGGPNEVGGGELINFNHHVHTVSQALSSTLFSGGSISPRQLALLRLASQGWSTRLPFTASMMEDPEAYDHSRLQAVFQAGFAIATQHESDCARMSKLLGGVTSKVSSSRRRAYESHPYQDASRRRYADASLPRGGGAVLLVPLLLLRAGTSVLNVLVATLLPGATLSACVGRAVGRATWRASVRPLALTSSVPL